MDDRLVPDLDRDTALVDQLPLPAPGGWMLEAVCVEADPTVFFPDRGEQPSAAVAICGRCPVQQECLDYAMKIEDDGDAFRSGVWGGTTPNQRARLASSAA